MEHVVLARRERAEGVIPRVVRAAAVAFHAQARQEDIGMILLRSLVMTLQSQANFAAKPCFIKRS